MITVLAVLGGCVLAVGIAAAMVLSDQAPAADAYAQFGAVCAWCGDPVDLVGDGYVCGACGFDSQEPQSPELRARLRKLQQLAIATSALESAAREFRASKSHRSGSGDTNRKHGPFPERYLEGMEQAQEARLIALDEDLQDALGILARIPSFTEIEELDAIYEQAGGLADQAAAVFRRRLAEAREDRPAR